MIRVIGAGLRGAGHAIGDAEVAAMTAPGGAAGFAAIVGELLTATFGGTARRRPAKTLERRSRRRRALSVGRRDGARGSACCGFRQKPSGR